MDLLNRVLVLFSRTDCTSRINLHTLNCYSGQTVLERRAKTLMLTTTFIYSMVATS